MITHVLVQKHTCAYQQMKKQCEIIHEDSHTTPVVCTDRKQTTQHSHKPTMRKHSNTDIHSNTDKQYTQKHTRYRCSTMLGHAVCSS